MPKLQSFGMLNLTCETLKVRMQKRFEINAINGLKCYKSVVEVTLCEFFFQLKS